MKAAPASREGKILAMSHFADSGNAFTATSKRRTHWTKSSCVSGRPSKHGGNSARKLEFVDLDEGGSAMLIDFRLEDSVKKMGTYLGH